MQGEDVLIDVLILSRASFLLKTSSAVGEFAIYFSKKLRLHKHSFDVQAGGLPTAAARE